MRQLRVWLWAGLVTAGVSAALLSGAAVASAGTESESGPSPVASQTTDSQSTDSGAGANRPHRILSKLHLKLTADADARSTSAADTGPTTQRPLGLLRTRLSSALGTSPSDEVAARVTSASDVITRPTTTHRTLGLLRATLSSALVAPPIETAARVTTATPPVDQTAARIPDAQPARQIGSLIGGIVSKVGSLAINAVQAVEAVVTGPPKVPPNSTVTVKTSTIQLSNGQTVPANWYFPTTDDGAPPDRMILLQHGFFAQGPMYSYTAANLAEQTNSIVVTPTLSSNPLAGDDYWLGGTGMASSIADLFEGDRDALTASAVDAGYAEAYNLNPATARLPQKFALEGHSLGANLVSGAAGFIAANCTSESCAADDLVGVILLDGVPVGDTLPDALDKLATYETASGHYIPVREIGAPSNLFNSTSTVNDDLTAARPGHFNGIVLDGGVHMDSMRGGNPLIQIAAYAVAGFPQPQNPPAVDQLSTTWLNEWFLTGDTGADDVLVPGSTVSIVTPQGTATGVVIGASKPNVLAGALSTVFSLLLSFLS